MEEVQAAGMDPMDMEAVKEIATGSDANTKGFRELDKLRKELANKLHNLAQPIISTSGWKTFKRTAEP